MALGSSVFLWKVVDRSHGSAGDPLSRGLAGGLFEDAVERLSVGEASLSSVAPPALTQKQKTESDPVLYRAELFGKNSPIRMIKE